MPYGKPADIEKLTPQVIKLAESGKLIMEIVRDLGMRHYQVKRILIKHWGADAYDRRIRGHYRRAARARNDS